MADEDATSAPSVLLIPSVTYTSATNLQALTALEPGSTCFPAGTVELSQDGSHLAIIDPSRTELHVLAAAPSSLKQRAVFKWPALEAGGAERLRMCSWAPDGAFLAVLAESGLLNIITPEAAVVSALCAGAPWREEGAVGMAYLDQQHVLVTTHMDKVYVVTVAGEAAGQLRACALQGPHRRVLTSSWSTGLSMLVQLGDGSGSARENGLRKSPTLASLHFTFSAWGFIDGDFKHLAAFGRPPGKGLFGGPELRFEGQLTASISPSGALVAVCGASPWVHMVSLAERCEVLTVSLLPDRPTTPLPLCAAWLGSSLLALMHDSGDVALQHLQDNAPVLDSSIDPSCMAAAGSFMTGVADGSGGLRLLVVEPRRGRDLLEQQLPPAARGLEGDRRKAQLVRRLGLASEDELETLESLVAAWRVRVLMDGTVAEKLESLCRGGEQEAALKLTQKLGISEDTYHRQCWMVLEDAGTEEVKRHLMVVDDPCWVMEQCCSMPASCEQAARLMLDHGLQVSEQLLKQEQAQEEMHWLATVRRLQFLRAQDLLNTFLAIHSGRYDPLAFQQFLMADPAASACLLAAAGNVAGVELLLARHAYTVTPHLLQVLSSFPETQEPRQLRRLLPSVHEPLQPPAQLPRQADWLEAKEFLAVMTEDMLLDSTEPAAAQAVGWKAPSLDSVAEWYCVRAEEVDDATGQLPWVVRLLELALEPASAAPPKPGTPAAKVKAVLEDATRLAACVRAAGTAAPDATWQLSLAEWRQLERWQQVLRLLSARSAAEPADASLLLPLLPAAGREREQLLQQLLAEGVCDNSSKAAFAQLIQDELRKPQLWGGRQVVADALLTVLRQHPARGRDWTCLQAVVGSALAAVRESADGGDAWAAMTLPRMERARQLVRAARLLWAHGQDMRVADLEAADAARARQLLSAVLEDAERQAFLGRMPEEAWLALWVEVQQLPLQLFADLDIQLVLQEFLASLLRCGEYGLAQDFIRGNGVPEIRADLAQEAALAVGDALLREAEELGSPQVAAAEAVLRLVPASPRTAELLQLLEAFQLISDAGLRNISPKNFRQQEQELGVAACRVALVEEWLGSQPEASMPLELVDTLIDKLSLSSPAQSAPIHMHIAHAAHAQGDLQRTKQLTLQLVEQQHAPAWGLALSLSRDRSLAQQEPETVRLLLSFAATHCDAAALPTVVAALRAADSELDPSTNPTLRATAAHEDAPDASSAEGLGRYQPGAGGVLVWRQGMSVGKLLRTAWGCAKHRTVTGGIPTMGPVHVCVAALLMLPDTASIVSMVNAYLQEEGGSLGYAHVQRVLQTAAFACLLHASAAAPHAPLTEASVAAAHDRLWSSPAELQERLQQEVGAGGREAGMGWRESVQALSSRLAAAADVRTLALWVPHVDAASFPSAGTEYQEEVLSELALVAGTLGCEVSGAQLYTEALRIASSYSVDQWRLQAAYLAAFVAAADADMSEVAAIVESHLPRLLTQPAELLLHLHMQLYPVLAPLDHGRFLLYISLTLQCLEALDGQESLVQRRSVLSELKAFLAEWADKLPGVEWAMLAGGLLQDCLLTGICMASSIRDSPVLLADLPAPEPWAPLAALWSAVSLDNVAELSEALQQLPKPSSDGAAAAAAPPEVTEAHARAQACSHWLEPSTAPLCLFCKLMLQSGGVHEPADQDGAGEPVASAGSSEALTGQEWPALEPEEVLPLCRQLFGCMTPDHLAAVLQWLAMDAPCPVPANVTGQLPSQPHPLQLQVLAGGVAALRQAQAAEQLLAPLQRQLSQELLAAGLPRIAGLDPDLRKQQLEPALLAWRGSSLRSCLRPMLLQACPLGSVLAIAAAVAWANDTSGLGEAAGSTGEVEGPAEEVVSGENVAGFLCTAFAELLDSAVVVVRAHMSGRASGSDVAGGASMSLADAVQLVNVLVSSLAEEDAYELVSESAFEAPLQEETGAGDSDSPSSCPDAASRAACFQSAPSLQLLIQQLRQQLLLQLQAFTSGMDSRQLAHPAVVELLEMEPRLQASPRGHATAPDGGPAASSLSLPRQAVGSKAPPHSRRVALGMTQAAIGSFWPDAELAADDLASVAAGEQLLEKVLPAARGGRDLDALQRVVQDVWANGHLWDDAASAEHAPPQPEPEQGCPAHRCWLLLMKRMLELGCARDVLRLLEGAPAASEQSGCERLLSPRDLQLLVQHAADVAPPAVVLALHLLSPASEQPPPADLCRQLLSLRWPAAATDEPEATRGGAAASLQMDVMGCALKQGLLHLCLAGGAASADAAEWRATEAQQMAWGVYRALGGRAAALHPCCVLQDALESRKGLDETAAEARSVALAALLPSLVAALCAAGAPLLAARMVAHRTGLHPQLSDTHGSLRALEKYLCGAQQQSVAAASCAAGLPDWAELPLPNTFTQLLQQLPSQCGDALNRVRGLLESFD